MKIKLKQQCNKQIFFSVILIALYGYFIKCFFKNNLMNISKILKPTVFGSLIIISSACSTSSDWDPSSTLPPTSEPPTTTYTDPELIQMVQSEALKYFWDYAETNSKLARERYHTDNPGHDANTVSTGGSGFGLMTILVGIKNGAIPRNEAVSRLTTALNFLQNANRFHGAWPHWINGANGNVIPFSTKDNGGDLVETAFLAQGLI